jgi:hypothetical protein
VQAVDPADCRRSGRIAGAPAEHTGAELDALSDSEDDEARACERVRKRRADALWCASVSSQAKPPKRARRTAAERDAEARAVLEHSRRWLAESRAALQQA